MNPIDQLRAARPAHLADTRVDEGTRAAELARAMATPRPAPARRRPAVRRGWGFGLAGAAATATAVAVAVSGGGGTAPRAPSDGSLAASRAPSADASAPPVRLSARAVLLAAAERAAGTADEVGAYWHTVTVSGSVFAAKGGGYRIVHRQRSEQWTPSATGGEQIGRSQTLGARPLAAEDEAAWRRAGSPVEIPVTVAGKPKPMTLSTRPGEVQDSRAPLVDGDKVFWLGRNVTFAELRGLPDDPGRLKAWLLRSYDGHDTESSGIPMSSDAWLFAVTNGLILDMPVTPAVRGAAFRMLAELKSIKVAGEVADGEGHTGTAVAITEPALKDGSRLESRLIFDEATGRPLGAQRVVVRSGGSVAGLPPGTVWNRQAVISAGWTDEAPGDSGGPDSGDRPATEAVPAP
ncbi:hypothetical protein Sru01_24160 [Sphaerisporangium rufum]|uniref:CU044_5270 family protein n=1 Tax=Sphaerisporangium rufum TaxID=1381558 RepID=A0A919R0J6_9ACTN|nr:CU044_5270 family protein [Sphaerisporangium rufum]GII77434.1 hypothetical protein Sru01_24160 [Sphaerisporangium rufum]